MSVWPRSSKKAGENQPQTRNSAKVDVYSRSVGSHMVSKIPIFDSPPNPHLAQRRLDDAQGELLQFRQRRVQRTHSTAVKPRSKPQNGMLRHMVPHLSNGSWGVSVDPRFPLRGAAWLEGLQHLSTNLFHGWAWGWFKRFKHCV